MIAISGSATKLRNASSILAGVVSVHTWGRWVGVPATNLVGYVGRQRQQTGVDNKEVGVLARRNLAKARKKHPDACVLVANDGNEALATLELGQGVQ